MKDRNLTAAQFKKTSALLPRMTGKNIALARRVLVDGDTFRAVATDAGCHPSNVSKVVRKFYNVYLDHILGCPEDWYQVSVCLPTKKAAAEVRKFEREALREFKRSSSGLI